MTPHLLIFFCLLYSVFSFPVFVRINFASVYLYDEKYSKAGLQLIYCTLKLPRYKINWQYDEKYSKGGASTNLLHS